MERTATVMILRMSILSLNVSINAFKLSYQMCCHFATIKTTLDTRKVYLLLQKCIE